jgi:hypothetical protein
MPVVFRQYLRFLALVLCWAIPLNAMAAPLEVVTLEEEPAAKSSKADDTPRKKKKKKKRKKAAPKPAEAPADDDDVEIAVEVEDDAESSAAEEAEDAAAKRKKKKKAEDEEKKRAAEEKKAAEAKKAQEEADKPPEPIDCLPELTEVETRRPIPLSCTFAKPITGMELRYRPPGEQWKTAKMKKVGEEWTAEIPCAATIKAGELEFTVSARSKKSKVVGKLDTITVKLAESTSEPPPAVPGLEPPARCFDPSECPGDMLGSPACPGTKKGKGVRSWGASCADSAECAKGLACVAGTCESPPKCKSDDECDSGMCSNGLCSFPDPEELKSQLGPPKYNWVGLELGVDFMLVRDAVGVCGSTTDDSDQYACFEGGSEYDGLPNVNNAGAVSSSVKLATMRAMVSYQRAIGRLLAGVRLGFAFRGAPEGFFPLHLEARGAYSLRSDPLKRTIRPYLGLAFGLAQVDTQSDVTIVDCASQACAQAAQIDQSQIMLGQAQVKELTAYRSGKKFFFGPTFTLMWAITNESAVVFNTNVMFPDLVIAPSVGYMLGL